MAGWVETQVHTEPDIIDKRLAELGLTRSGLVSVVKAARTASGNATALHASNAAGTFGYHEGIVAFRREYLGKNWVMDRSGQVETIRNDTTGVRVGFCHVHRACDDCAPKPRSDKGAAAERACGEMLFDPDQLRYHVRDMPDGTAFYYLMVDEAGRAELTRPVVSGRTFKGAIERIFLLVDSDEDDMLLTLDDDTDIADTFEPQIVRK